MSTKRRSGSAPLAPVGGSSLRSRGKRTGVTVPYTNQRASDGFENIDAAFENVRSPDPADMAAGESPMTEKSPARRPVLARKEAIKPQFIVPGATGKNKDLDEFKEPGGTIMNALGRRGSTKSFISPSDLSTVSTAPPTPASVSQLLSNEMNTPAVTQDATQEMGQKQSRQDEVAQEENSDNDLVPPPPANFGVEEEDDGELDHEAAQRPDGADADVGQNLIAEDDDGGFPVPDDYDGDFDDDDKEGRGFEFSGEGESASFNGEENKSEDSPRMQSQGDWRDSTSTEKSPRAESLKTPNEKANSATNETTETETEVMEPHDFSRNTAKRFASPNASEDDFDIDGRNTSPVGNSPSNLNDDHEAEGGVNVINDPETPQYIREKPSGLDRQKKRQQKKSILKRPGGEEDLSDSEAQKMKKKRKKKVRISMSPPGYAAGNRDYSLVPIDDYKEQPHPSEKNLRRSKRARLQPLQFWKNERPVYEGNNEKGQLREAMGNMPVVGKILIANPTPRKKRKVPEKKASKGTNQKAGKYNKSVDPDEKPFDARKLKRKHDYMKGSNALVWNDGLEDIQDEQVVSYSRDLERFDLPLSKDRKKSDGKVVGRAAQAFNIPNDPDNEDQVGYIMGHLALPPKGMKDHESVGACVQTFTVCTCQQDALELSYADHQESKGEYEDETAQRFLLGPGDMFRVPPGNTYQLKNHSKTHECLLSWTIIKPRET